MLYNGELDTLEIRLHELAHVVDRFVVVESDVTHSGMPRAIRYDAAHPRLLPFVSKIVHVIVKDMPDTTDPRQRETWQRNAVLRGMPDAASDDLVMMSDVDEVPRASVVEAIKRDREHRLFGLRLAFYYFYLNYRNVRGPEAALTWAVAAARAELDKITPDGLRFAARHGDPNVHVLPDAGWHFSYLMDEAGIQRKIQAFSHQEWNTKSFLSSIDIKATVHQRGDLFNRPSHVWDVVEEPDLPSWILQNRRNSLICFTSRMAVMKASQETKR